MTTLLQDTIVAAEESGEDWKLPLFYATTDDDVIRATWLLSITIGLARNELEELLVELWPSVEHPGLIVDQLLEWPIARAGADTIQITEALTSSVAQDFADKEPEAFSRAHELLVALEEHKESAEAPDDDWFVRGRTAFYLAGIRPADSVEEFGQLFANAPSTDRVACRVWVTSLVLRQEYLLEDQARALIFFRAFRAYVLGRRADARQGFEEVVRGESRDVYGAISLHLLGVLLRSRDPSRAVQLLEQSIAMSEELELLDNELMARNSLVWARHAVAQGSGQLGSELPDLFALARSNAERVRARQDEVGVSLASGVWRTALVLDWLRATRNRTDPGRVPPERVHRIVRHLRSIRNVALDSGDIETAVFAANDAAGVLRDVQRFDEALGEVDQIVGALQRWRWLPMRATKLSQTVGSIVSRSPEAGIQAHGTRLLGQLDDLTTTVEWARLEAVTEAPTGDAQGV